jgi:hypothetical protein
VLRSRSNDRVNCFLLKEAEACRLSSGIGAAIMSDKSVEFYITNVGNGESGRTTVIVGRAGDRPIPVGTRFARFFKSRNEKYPEGCTDKAVREKGKKDPPYGIGRIGLRTTGSGDFWQYHGEPRHGGGSLQRAWVIGTIVRSTERLLMHCRSRSRRLVVLTWIGAVVALALAPAPPEAPIPPLNQKVLEFTRERIGKKVADGQCLSLAVEALRFAGAKRYPFDPGGDYVWGRPVASFKDALPGDIIQFRDAVFEGKRWLTKRRWVSWHYEYPHHTAIVSEVREQGRVVAILHQNVGAHDADEATKQIVQEASIRPESLQAGGTVTIFRPVARDDGDVHDKARQFPAN